MDNPTAGSMLELERFYGRDERDERPVELLGLECSPDVMCDNVCNISGVRVTLDGIWANFYSLGSSNMDLAEGSVLRFGIKTSLPRALR